MVRQRALTMRSTYIVAAATLALASVVPFALFGKAKADQVQFRSIEMSTSNVGQTAVTYQIAFKAATAPNHTAKSMVIDFCGSSPIIGTACSSPTGSFAVGGSLSSVLINGASVGAGTTDTSNWTIGSLNSGRTLTLTNATGSTLTAGQYVTIVATGFTNPGTTAGTFYSRILTYPNDTGANSAANYVAGTEGTYTDAGGIALSTTNLLSVTAKVQEQLTFCVYTSGSDCAGGTGSSINVPTSSTTPLSASAVQTDTSASFGLSSNALNGVVVRMKGFDPLNPTSTRASLTSGANSIAAFGGGSGTCTADSVVTSVDQFGMRFASVGAGLTANSSFGCSAGNHGWDTSTANDNITATYGKQIASTAGANAEVQSNLEFAAKSALTTPAGIYTIGLSFIATGTY
jgi:hypothetical protein